jgi:uncharacterized Ntn-hydrolase superfamily protein
MESGSSAQEALDRLLKDDPDREQRQVGFVDSQGGSASFTGSECFAWAGGIAGTGYSIQGNILASGRVVPAMEKAYIKAKGNLPQRLLAALTAGDRAGGDRRGRQSAAIYVAKPKGGYGGHLDRWIDYRVDDHENPVPRLGELLEVHDLFFGKSPETDRVRIIGKAMDQLVAILRRQGYLKNDKSFENAFNEFIGNENFEERADPQAQWIDKPVLKYLFKKFMK